MKFTEFVYKPKEMQKLPLYIISGNEYFLKKQVLTEMKKQFFSNGGTVQGLVEFGSKENIASRRTGDNGAQNTKVSTLSFGDILDEVGTTSMFGKCKLVIVENADNFLNRYQHKLLEYIKSPFKVNSLVLDVQSIDKRTKFARALDNKSGVLIECNKLYVSPAPWEKGKPEYDSELTKWIVMHTKSYDKILNLKTAFYLIEKTGNDLAIIDKQIDLLSTYIGDRKEISIEDIQKVLGFGHREKLYNLLDAIGMKDIISAAKIAKVLFDIGIENERKNIMYDGKSIAIVIINSLHKRMKDLWKTIRVLDKGGDKQALLEEISIRRLFVDKIIKQSQNFTEEEMPEKWKYMLEADLLCKTSRLSPILVIEQLITKLCS